MQSARRRGLRAFRAMYWNKGTISAMGNGVLIASLSFSQTCRVYICSVEDLQYIVVLPRIRNQVSGGILPASKWEENRKL